jgi:hypothetical protein
MINYEGRQIYSDIHLSTNLANIVCQLLALSKKALMVFSLYTVTRMQQIDKVQLKGSGSTKNIQNKWRIGKVLIVKALVFLISRSILIVSESEYIIKKLFWSMRRSRRSSREYSLLLG